jgi:hypothetical protein
LWAAVGLRRTYNWKFCLFVSVLHS